MPVVISLLRGVNLGGHHLIKMEALRKLYEDLGHTQVQSYVQSGNVVFRTKRRNLATVGKQIEASIEASFGFRPSLILRTLEELRATVAANPFAGRDGIEPSKLAVIFLAGDPGAEASQRISAIPADPEELHLVGRELFIYFPSGMGQSKLPFALLDKALKVVTTARNWNSVTKLLNLAEAL